MNISNKNTHRTILNAIRNLEIRMDIKSAKARLFILEGDEISMLASSDAFQEVLGTAYEKICEKAFRELKEKLSELKSISITALQDELVVN